MYFVVTLAGIELGYLVNEISNLSQGYYVSNIYGITNDSILFKLHHPEKPDIHLMLTTFGIWRSSARIDQIEKNKMIKRLRSDLLRLKLTKIEQLEDERIAYLTFSGFDKEFVIVGEFFGDGNIILCNKEMKILALQHSIDVRHRKLHIGLQYEPPPSSGLNVFEMVKKDLDGLKESPVQCAKWIGRTLGLPKKYAEEVCKRGKIDPKSLGSSLTDNDIANIYESTEKIIDEVINGKHDPYLIKKEKNSDVYPIKLGEKTDDFKSIPSYNEGLDSLFTEKIIQDGKSIQTSETDQKISELETKLGEQTKAISTVKEKSRTISTVAHSLFNLVSLGVNSIDDPRSIENLTSLNSKLITEKGINFIKIHDEKIKINPTSSLPTIASSLFDESKKQSGAIKSIEKLIKKTEKGLLKLKNQAEVVKESVTYKEIRKKNWYERYRWFHTSDGLLAIGGRDSSSNSSIIRKHLEKDDKVFHADIFGSPFFILKKSQDPPTKSLNEVAHVTVCFSRAWREAMYGLSAYWVNPNQVKKAAPSGQFLPKGSFTIDGQRNFVKVPTMKLSVGLFKQDENYLLSCGPFEPIKKNSVCYAVIEPTGQEMTDAAKKVKNEFTKLKGEIVKSMDIDEFVRVLPAGKSHITEVGFGDDPDP